MKKSVLIALVLCMTFAAGVFAASGITLVVNGQIAQGVDVRVIDGTTYLPLRAVGDLLKVPVSWDGTKKMVTVGTGLPAGTVIPTASTLPISASYTVEDSSGKALYSFKINKITITAERNQYSDKNPKQVILIDYTYTNIANPDDLFLSELNFKVIDSSGTIGDSYPAGPSKYPQSIPTGTTCNAIMCYGLEHFSKSVKIAFHDNMFESATKTFNLAVTEY